MTCRREVRAFTARSSGQLQGSAKPFFRYHVMRPEMQPYPAASLRLDFGTVGIGSGLPEGELTNRGKEILKWSVESQGNHARKAASASPGRFVSFFYEAVKVKGGYAPPAI
jgi:hypothetical protein